jgi:acetoin utilization protein AcuB
MTPSPVTVSADMPAEQARERMQTHSIRHVLVTEGGVLIGILSTRDLGPDRAAESSPAPKGSVTVGDVMTRSVFAIGAEAQVTAAAALMRRHRIGALPVFDRGRIVGILTRTDLLGALMSALPVAPWSRRAGVSPVDHAPIAAPCQDVEPGYGWLGEVDQREL